MVGKLSYSWPATAQQTKVNRFDSEYAPLFPYGYGLSYGEVDPLSSALSEKLDRKIMLTNTMTIFDGSVKAPWQLMIGSKGIREPVLSSLQSSEFVEYQTHDKDVQEDACQLVFNGQGKGEVILVNQSAVDMKRFQGSVISIEPKLWQTLTVELVCFTQAGLDLEQVSASFSLSSSGKLNLVFSNISIEPLKGKIADVSCH
ncbi:hypothetical protein Sps_03674 [Shewanella psychrophila]|uniref:ExoP galactose-binding-like domain-containing protein n=1 Tax=Shewanella psychrophila TaxID=225848 RepID=A0A1S6HTG0_9GAMM|nr:hypothetical protein Sps_03674 [Shewanella psychrophila]